MNKIKYTILYVLLGTSSVYSASPYIEGQVNFNQVQDVDSISYSGTVSGYTYSNFKITNKYKSDTGYGFEIGAKEVIDKNLRLGISYGETKIKLKSTTGTGTISDGTTTVTASGTVSRADLASVGVSFDNDVKSYSINGYYDFTKMNQLTPFIGLGIGQVDIQNAKDKELSTSLYLGARYSVDPKIYVGAKANYTMVNGPEDKFGIKYDDIYQYGITISVGYEF